MLRACLAPFLILLLATGCATSNEVDDGDGDGGGSGGTTNGTGANGTGTGQSCANPPVASASNSGPACDGDAVSLAAQTVAGATYAWTGPNGFSSNEQSPMLAGFGFEDAGTYTLVVTVDGCSSAPATTEVAGATEQAAFSQTSTSEFDANTNTSVDTAGDEVTLGSVLDTGTGADGAYAPGTSTTLAGGTYNFTTVTIPAGVTVTVSGNQPLVIKATGTVSINGVIDASGTNGGDGVTFSTFGTGGTGRGGGANGGNGSYSSSAGPLAGAVGAGTGPGAAGGGWSGGGGGGHVAVGGSSGGGGGAGGMLYGTADLMTLTFGSGGGGGSGGLNCGAGGGGGGGGGIWISAQTIAVGAAGAIRANGGAGGSDGTGNCGGGGGGSGGSIRLSTGSLSVNGSVTAQGGAGGASAIAGSPYFGVGGTGSAGRIRLDYGAFSGSGSISPMAGFEGSTAASAGSMVTALIPAPEGFCSWGTLTYTANEPAGTAIEVDVLDATDTVIAAAVPSGTDLSTLLEGVTAVRLRAIMTTTGAGVPVLEDWALGYSGL